MAFLQGVLAQLLWIIIKTLVPPLVAFLSKRKTPEQEAAWRDAEKRGEKWNHMTNKPEKWGR